MNSMQPVISQLELQTLLFKNATKEFEDDLAGTINGEANHVKWLTGHTVSTRYMMANLIGLKQAEPFPELFAEGKGRQDNVQYPSMTALVKSWDDISEKIISRLKEMKDADFNATAPFPHPMSDGTYKGLFGFFAHHEAYTIGQISYARRIHGMEAMKYN
jgi:hypothetical protein